MASNELTLSAVVTHNLSHAEILYYETSPSRLLRALAFRNALLPARALVGTYPNLMSRATIGDVAQLALLERLHNRVSSARAHAYTRRFTYGCAYDVFLLTSSFLGVSPLSPPSGQHQQPPSPLTSPSPSRPRVPRRPKEEEHEGRRRTDASIFISGRAASEGPLQHPASLPMFSRTPPAHLCAPRAVTRPASLADGVPTYLRQLQQSPGMHAMPMPMPMPMPMSMSMPFGYPPAGGLRAQSMPPSPRPSGVTDSSGALPTFLLPPPQERRSLHSAEGMSRQSHSRQRSNLSASPSPSPNSSASGWPPHGAPPPTDPASTHRAQLAAFANAQTMHWQALGTPDHSWDQLPIMSQGSQTAHAANTKEMSRQGWHRHTSALSEQQAPAPLPPMPPATPPPASPTVDASSPVPAMDGRPAAQRNGTGYDEGAADNSKKLRFRSAARFLKFASDLKVRARGRHRRRHQPD